MCFTNNKFKQVNWREIHNRRVCYVFRLRTVFLQLRSMLRVIFPVIGECSLHCPEAQPLTTCPLCGKRRVLLCRAGGELLHGDQPSTVGWMGSGGLQPHLGFTPWQAKWAFCTTVWCGTCCISSVDLNRNINFWNGLISKNEPNTDSLSKHILFHHRRCKWIMCGLLKSKFKFRTEFTIAAIYSSTGTKWPISQDRKLIWFIFSKNYIKSSFLHWPFLDFK